MIFCVVVCLLMFNFVESFTTFSCFSHNRKSLKIPRKYLFNGKFTILHDNGLSVDSKEVPISLTKKIGNLIAGKGFSGIDGAAIKQRLAQLGISALLSYGFVSNFSYVTTVIIAWCIHGKATAMSPLSPGQWKPFLAIYAGLWAANNVLRPLRFSVSVVIAPFFEKLVDHIQQAFNLKRSFAFGMTVFLVNFCGTISYLLGGLFLATKILGLPL